MLKLEQRKFLFNAFITTQFSYASVVWMVNNWKLNNHNNRIHEKVLRIIYQDHYSTFDEILVKGGSFKIYGCNFPKLLIETFIVKMKLALEIMIRTQRYGIETAAFVGSRVRNYMPNELKKSRSINELRSKIKIWKPENRVNCKIYLQGIG